MAGERRLEVTVTGDASGFDRAMGAANKTLGGFGTAMKGLAGVATTAGVAAGAALAKAFADGLQVDKLGDKMAARMGLDPAEAERMARLSGDIYAGAWGDSLAEVNLALEGVSRNLADFGSTSDADLTNITTQVLDIASAFDLDVNEAISAASSMLRTGLAPDAETAMDILTTGLQRAGGDSGELLESLNEYSEQFASLGIDGQTAVGMLTAGFEAGAFSVDKVGDAVKEFSIRAIDGSAATQQAFKDLGFDADEMAQKIAGGGPAAKEAMGEIISALSNVGDKVKQDEAGVALFGSMWEDVGPDVIAALNPIDQKLGDISTAAEDMGSVLNDNLSTRLEEMKRGAQQKMAEIGLALVGVADQVLAAWREGGFGAVMDLIGEKVSELAPIIREKMADAARALWEWIQEAVPIALQRLGELITAALQWLSSSGLPRLREAMGQFLPALSQWIADAIPVVAAKLVELGTQFVIWVAKILPPLLIELGKIMVLINQWILTDLLPKVGIELGKLVLEFLDWVVDVLAELPGKLGELWQAFADWFTNDAGPGMAEGAETLAGELLEWVTNFLRDLPGRLAEIMSAFATWITGTVLPWALGAASDIAIHLINFGAQFLSALPGTLATMLRSIVQTVLGWGTALLLLASGIAVKLLNFGAQFIASLPGTLASMISNLVAGILSWGRGLLETAGILARKIKDGIIEGLKNLWQLLRDSIQNALNRAANALNPVNIGKKIVTGGGNWNPINWFGSMGGQVPQNAGPVIAKDGHMAVGLLPEEIVVNPAAPSRGMKALAESGLLDSAPVQAAGGGSTIHVTQNIYALSPDPDEIGRAAYDGLRRFQSEFGPLDLDIAG